jgi:putative CocE/NonD family hydrolase
MKSIFTFALLFCLNFVSAQDFKIQEFYNKQEVYITMRDGKKLFTAIYTPKDQSKKYPILLNRTPYAIGPYGEDQFPSKLRPTEAFAKAGYIFVFQDVRGKFMSEGDFVNMTPMLSDRKNKKATDESTDTYDCIEWCLKNIKNNNGRVGQWGISYPGFYTAAGMVNAHPALKAVSPQAPIVDWFTGDDFHHNGVLFVPHFFGFFASFGKERPELTKQWTKGYDFPTNDGYDFYLNQVKSMKFVDSLYKGKIAFWKDIVAHPNYDEFWQKRNLRPHLKDIKPAVLTVGGWFDAENLYGALQVYQTVEKNSIKSNNKIVMGPWIHGGWNRTKGSGLGDMSFKANTCLYYQDSIEFPFFEAHLRNKTADNLPEASVFETGTNVWKSYETWPPKQTKESVLYLSNNGVLRAFENKSLTFEEYTSDPNKPVPYMVNPDIGMQKEYMVADQRFASTRPDVLVYKTEKLEAAKTILGPIEVELMVSSTNTDMDFVVKIIDVNPAKMPNDTIDGRIVNVSNYQSLIRCDIFRAKYRNSFEKPEPLIPGEMTKIKFTLNDINHAFLPGHQIMVQVQSTWFPLTERNPQQFMNIFEAEEKDFIKGTNRIYRGSKITFKELE